MNWKQTLILMVVALMAVTSAAVPAAGSPQVRSADLTIEQPRHVSGVVTSTTENGASVYVASGKYLEIEPNNFNSSAVTDFSVQESEGVLSYDKGDGEYVLNTQGNAGTYHLHWTVSEGNSTARYSAVIRVSQASFAHVPSSQYEQLRSDHQRYEGLISSIESSGDPDTPLEQKVAFGNQVREFANNPFSALTGQFMALQILRFTTPAGWIDLTIIILLVYGGTRGLYATLARFRKQLEAEEKVSRREDEQYLKMFRQVLAGKQMTDVDAIDDHQAAVLENSLGNNLYTALQNFWTTWGEDSLKRMYSDAMGSVGYAVRVVRDDTGAVQSVEVLDPEDGSPMADGGEPEDGEDWTAVDPGAMDTTEDTMNLSNAPDDVLEALRWEQVDDRVFQKNPDISAVDHLMTANRDRPGDLISELNVSIPEDFSSRQEFMEAIAHFIAEVMETEFTDEQNVPREDRAVLNNVMAFTTVMSDQYDVPLDLYWRACIWNAEGLSRDDEAESVLADITDAGEVMDDVDTPGGRSNRYVGGD